MRKPPGVMIMFYNLIGVWMMQMTHLGVSILMSTFTLKSSLGGRVLGVHGILLLPSLYA